MNDLGRDLPLQEETSAVFADIMEQEGQKRKASNRELLDLCGAAGIRLAASQRPELGCEACGIGR
jgi:hypothetical protein